MDSDTLEKILNTLKSEYKKWNAPVVTLIKERTNDPYKILISTVLSLRTQDKTTHKAAERLFKVADTPEKMVNLTEKEIEKLIYPVGFYRTKAKNIKKISQILLDKYDGKVPDDLDELLKLPGVGRKTANLVITLGYGKLGICVDTHVHRISNRLGIVNTKTPFETEMELRRILPKKWWIEYNDMLVSLGQTICRPINPKCDRCPLNEYCPKIGVKVKSKGRV